MIRYLQIENLKSLRHTPMVKLGILTLLTGANGRGKSSFVQSILMLSQSLRNSVQHTPESLLANGDWLNLGDFKDVLTVDREKDQFVIHFKTDDEHDAEYRLTYIQSDINPAYGKLVSMEVDGEETFSQNVSYNNLGPESENVLTAPVFSGYTSLLNLQKIFYVAAWRNAASNEIVANTAFLDCQGKNVLNFILRKDEHFRNALQEALSRILDGATFKLENDGTILHLFMDAVDNGNRFNPINVGYRYSYIITLITAILSAEKGDLLIIENPEAHLHPKAQSKMMELLVDKAKETGFQVIMETHSDHIVNSGLLGVNRKNFATEDLQIVFFDRAINSNDAVVSNLEITRQGTVQNPPSGFCDQYNIELEELMGF